MDEKNMCMRKTDLWAIRDKPNILTSGTYFLKYKNKQKTLVPYSDGILRQAWPRASLPQTCQPGHD